MTLFKVFKYMEKFQALQMIHMMKIESTSVQVPCSEMGYVNIQNEINIFEYFNLFLLSF